jgi:hypothetical protein
MYPNRFFHRYTVGTALVAGTLLGTLLLPAGPANAAPVDTLGDTIYLKSFAPPSRDSTATTTTLTTSPASPTTQGSPVALTAIVTPARADGAVQFKDGTTNLSNPVPVSNGTASGTTSQLPVGSHALTAVFTPTNRAAFSPSTSPTLTFVITNSAGPPTTGSPMIGPAPIRPLPIGPLPIEPPVIVPPPPIPSR